MKVIINDAVTIEPVPGSCEIISSKGDLLMVRMNGVNRAVRVIETDPGNKFFKFELDKKVYHAQVRDHLDLLVESMGLNKKASIKISEIKAPMPGQIKQILTRPDAEVKKGDGLLIIEAMKMENSIASPVDGVIEKILVKAGEAVEKNHVLIKFRD